MQSGYVGTALPSYRQLPSHDVLGGRTSWGVFGDDDELGTIGLIGDEQVVAATAEIVTGRRFSLSLPLGEPDPPPGARALPEHTIFRRGRNTQDDRLDSLFMQASSQWDGLRHVQAREFGFYNGTSEADAGPEGAHLGIERWVEHGIMGRCVLVDVARWAARVGEPLRAHAATPITPEMLRDTISTQGVDIRRGDVLLLRTGYLEAYREDRRTNAPVHDYREGCPGLVGTEAMAELLWDLHVAAVCADNPAVEVMPGNREDGSLHRRAIAMLGIAFGELFDMDALADDCAKDGRYSAFFTAVPLNVRGAVGSPANAVACK